MVKRGDKKEEAMVDRDLERASLTGSLKEKKEESKQCCNKKVIGLTVLSIVGVIGIFLGGSYYFSSRAVTEARNSNSTNTVQKTPTFLEVDVIMDSPPPHREFGNQIIGKWKLHSSDAPIPYYKALGMGHMMANIVTKLESVMVIELTSDGFIQTSTVTGLAGAALPEKLKTHIVKPIFGKKIEGIYNGISKDEEDWFATAFPDRWEIYVTHHDLTIDGGEKLSEHMTMKLRTVTDEKTKKETRELTVHRLLNDELSTECTWFLRPAK